jgi:hypothetical protein
VCSTSIPLKKNGTLAIADLALRLAQGQMAQLRAAAELPDQAQYTFDILQEMAESNQTADSLSALSEPESEAPGRVQKTTHRTVVTLKYGRLTAREVVRRTSGPNGQMSSRQSSELARLVAPGCRYGYDLIAYVGCESFLNGRRLNEIQRDLEQRSPSLQLPLSSLDELRRRFLFNVGEVHRQAAPRLRDALTREGGLTWLIDGTLEPGTPLFFGVQEPRSAILLGCRKIPTENAEDISPCLKLMAQQYGVPRRILHDLSTAMSLACHTALPHVPQQVCHFHFASDVGDDLLAAPQQALSGRFRELGLQVQLREQRKTQTEWLRDHAGATGATLILQRLLRGESWTQTWDTALRREVLLAFHFWMLDYAADGGRQGFPFDPHALYLHRRLIRGHEALTRLLSRTEVATAAPLTLLNLHNHLTRYRQDPQIVQAARHYEIAFREFDRLRTILRLASQGGSPMHHGYDLTSGQDHQIQAELNTIQAEYRQRVADCSDENERSACRIVLTHVEKYLPYLLPPNGFGSGEGVRTTNTLEGYWSETKRGCRHLQGRRKLTRSFEALPAELMLIPNLHRAEYVQIVLDGSLEHLAAKFAEAQSQSPSYAGWRTTNRSLNLGRLPTRILRQTGFLEHLIKIYDSQCQPKYRRPA